MKAVREVAPRRTGKEAWKVTVVFDCGWKGGEGGCFGIGSEEVWEETAAGGGACRASHRVE